MSGIISGYISLGKRIGLKKTKIYMMVKKGELPAPRQISDRKIGWLESDIEAWEKSRPVVSWAPKDCEV